MGKLSSYPADATPQMTDYLLGNQASGPTTQRFLLSSFLNWITIPSITYSSYDSANKTGVADTSIDLTPYFGIGSRFQFTQSTVQWAIITAISSTQITFFLNTDSSLSAGAMSSPMMSNVKAPVGFPLNPAKWTVTATSANTRTTTSGSWTSLTDSISVPIGAWNLYWKAYLDINPASSNLAQTMMATLSSTLTTETNPNLTLACKGGFNATGSSKEWGSISSAQDPVTTTSATTFTVLGQTTSGTTGSIVGASTQTLLRATCAYL